MNEGRGFTLSNNNHNCPEETVINQFVKVQTDVCVTPRLKPCKARIIPVDPKDFDCRCKDREKCFDKMDDWYKDDCRKCEKCSVTQLFLIEVPIEFDLDVDVDQDTKCCICKEKECYEKDYEPKKYELKYLPGEPKASDCK